jgi:hypothetical protein
MRCRCIEWNLYPITYQTSKNKLLNLKLHPSPPILWLEKIIGLSNPKMAQLFMHMIHKVLMLFWVNYTLHSSIYPHHRRELLSHLNCLALCITQFRSFGVNPTRTSLTCRCNNICIHMYVQNIITFRFNVHIRVKAH